MANTLLLKKSGVSDETPAANELTHGELALNYADGKIYFKNSSNAVSELISAPGTGAGQVLFSSAGASSINGDSTFFYDDSNNRLGIGTASPTNRVHIVGGDVAHNALYVETNSAWGSPLRLNNARNDTAIEFSLDFYRYGASMGHIGDNKTDLYMQSNASTLFRTNNGTLALTLDTSQNATFAGNVQAGSAKSFGDPKHKSLTKTQSGTVAGTDTLMTTFTITVPYSSFWAPGYIVVRGSGSIANIAGRTSIYKRYRYVNYGGSGYALDEDESDIVGDMDVTTSSPNAQTLTFNVRYNDTNYDGTARTMIANVTVAGYYGVTIT